MKLEELEEYLNKIIKIKIDDLNIEEHKTDIKEIIKAWDSKEDSKEVRTKEFFIIRAFFHKYICKMYDNKVEAKFLDSNSNLPNFYSSKENRIYYATNWNESKSDAMTLIFQVMHENRHAVQEKQFKSQPSDILEIDPLMIVMMKEMYMMATKRELYDKNHSSFIIENDASLCADKYLENFIKNYLSASPEYLAHLSANAPKEKTNYMEILRNGDWIGDFRFQNAEEGILPVVYEADRAFRENVVKEDLERYPLLKLICNDDGTLKSYKQIILDKKQRKKEYQNAEPITRCDSLSDFKEDNRRSSDKQIDNVYAVIINSNPMLYLEDCLNYNRNNKIKELFETTPELFDIYINEITNIVNRYVDIKNYEKLEKIFGDLKNEKILQGIDKRIKSIVKKEIRIQVGIEIDEYMLDDEDVLKDVNVLNKEENDIITKLQEKVNKGELDKNIVEKYTKIVHEIYSDYKENSLINNPNQKIGESNKYEELEEVIDYIDSDLYENEVFMKLCIKYKDYLITEEDIKSISRTFREQYKQDVKKETEKIDDIEENIR